MLDSNAALHRKPIPLDLPNLSHMTSACIPLQIFRLATLSTRERIHSIIVGAGLLKQLSSHHRSVKFVLVCDASWVW